MSLKSEIKKTVNLHSNKFKAVKVWEIEEVENYAGSITLYIEVEVKKKKIIKPSKKQLYV